jgi:class 3 adenylate cyclase
MAEVTAERKLTTILAADVVGYSKMMATDEEATLATLRTYRQVTEGLVEKHNGRVFSTAGDAFLAEFGSAVEAVRCGISIQEDLAVRNTHLSEDRQMWFRIGINVGDVIIENGDLFGDGVNVAARLEGLAEKGGICISGSTFDHVKNKLSIAFDDIGAQNVKNIPEPIPAFRIVPGRVAVTGDEGSKTSSKPILAGGYGHLAAAVATVIAILLGGAYLAGIFPDGHYTHPYDGHWKVTVNELSGCQDNSPKSYTIKVKGGKIDEPQHLLPKTGSISLDGEFNIKTTDQAGNQRNTQVANITGDVGKGRFEGRKPTCTGEITIVRLD